MGDLYHYLDDPVTRGFISSKSDWYRIPEREETRYPVSVKIGQSVRIKDNFLVRCGYYCQPEDVSYGEVSQLAKDEILAFFNRIGAKSDRDAYDDFLKLVGGGNKYRMEDVLLRNLIYRKRWELVCKERKRLKECGFLPLDLRTFWYGSLDAIRSGDLVYTVSGKKSRWVGEYYPPSTSHYSTYDGDDYDYDPGGISNKVYQQVVLVTSETSRIGSLYVHPLDIIPV